MNTPGEAQHYTLALLVKLFEHLPLSVIVQILYDIVCQLHQSCIKWGFLKPYMSCTTFSISIFHAFSHQWPCQIIYHLCKTIGYGLLDGEGAERLWHSLSQLIAYGQVAGFHVRMYHLNSQLEFANEEGLFKLGGWLRCKLFACNAKWMEATQVLASCRFEEQVLYNEWEKQVQVQTKPLPCMFLSLTL
ncbi:hypothetical protein GYMLUDRAFT_181113 [Collybiopsis luxurians FD-317 M1]|uniref:Uncharacterized protein n=1 Tax=Collybiopsis luxurians FD-317 M1 TaxID=944289 RepID=A0A0D0AN85_9AGAR|nr:hypothetical protein GYMLUDRAFT_181113 [Collybiopsis luxurians FD-317 M1]